MGRLARSSEAEIARTEALAKWYESQEAARARAPGRKKAEEQRKTMKGDRKNKVEKSDSDSSV